MHEAEIQSLITLICRGVDIRFSLFLGHGCPLLITPVVPCSVVQLHRWEP